MKGVNMISKKLNGGEVLSFIRTNVNKNEGYVLVANVGSSSPYVTAYWNDTLENEWAMGHYFSSFDDAFTDLLVRAQ
jgi:hypothetical protein